MKKSFLWQTHMWKYQGVETWGSIWWKNCDLIVMLPLTTTVATTTTNNGSTEVTQTKGGCIHEAFLSIWGQGLLLSFACCDLNTYQEQLRCGKVNFASQFQRFSSWWVNPIALVSRWGRSSWWKDMVEDSYWARGSQEAWKARGRDYREDAPFHDSLPVTHLFQLCHFYLQTTQTFKFIWAHAFQEFPLPQIESFLYLKKFSF